MTRVIVNLDALEAAARAASKGPWRLSKGDPPVYGAVVSDDITGYDDPENVEAYGGHIIGESITPRNRNYLIAASPDVILALIQRVRSISGLPFATYLEADIDLEETH